MIQEIKRRLTETYGESISISDPEEPFMYIRLGDKLIAVERDSSGQNMVAISKDKYDHGFQNHCEEVHHEINSVMERLNVLLTTDEYTDKPE